MFDRRAVGQIEAAGRTDHDLLREPLRRPAARVGDLRRKVQMIVESLRPGRPLPGGGPQTRVAIEDHLPDLEQQLSQSARTRQATPAVHRHVRRRDASSDQ
jgi:hypothetical protein